MSSYTTQLRRVISLYGEEEVKKWFTNYELSDYLLPSQIETIEKANVWSKEKLADKIIKHYYTREIGAETPGLFKHFAEMTMSEIMEEYLPIIYSNSIEYDPLVNVDFTETFEREIEGSNKNTGKSNSNSQNNASGLNVGSDTPEGRINKSDILKGDYASNTNASETESNIKDKTETENQGTSNTKELYTKKQKGNSGTLTTAQALIQQYRQTIYAVDKEIIEKLNILFMGVF